MVCNYFILHDNQKKISSLSQSLSPHTIFSILTGMACGEDRAEPSSTAEKVVFAYFGIHPELRYSLSCFVWSENELRFVFCESFESAIYLTIQTGPPQSAASAVWSRYMSLGKVKIHFGRCNQATDRIVTRSICIFRLRFMAIRHPRQKRVSDLKSVFVNEWIYRRRRGNEQG